MAGYSMKASVPIEERQALFLKPDIEPSANLSKHHEDRWHTFSSNDIACIPQPPGGSIEAKSITHDGSYKLQKPSLRETQWPKLRARRFRPSLRFCISRGGKTWWPGRPIESHKRRSPFVEYEKYREGDAAKPCRVVPLQLLAEVQDGKTR